MKNFRQVGLGMALGAIVIALLAAVPAAMYFGTFNGPVNAQNLTVTNFMRFATNPIVANTLDCSINMQMTNCSADPTFSGISGIVSGQGFSDVIFIFANGGNRTLTITAPNVHVYPSGALVTTNGSFSTLTLGGVGGSITGAVFLAFP